MKLHPEQINLVKASDNCYQSTSIYETQRLYCQCRSRNTIKIVTCMNCQYSVTVMPLELPREKKWSLGRVIGEEGTRSYLYEVNGKHYRSSSPVRNRCTPSVAKRVTRAEIRHRLCLVPLFSFCL